MIDPVDGIADRLTAIYTCIARLKCSQVNFGLDHAATIEGLEHLAGDYETQLSVAMQHKWQRVKMEQNYGTSGE